VSKRLNLTYTTGIVLSLIAAGHRYGFDIMDVSGLPDGTVYPALRRLEKAGLLRSAWEVLDADKQQTRPPRCYYELTIEGTDMLQRAVERFPGLTIAEATPEGA
jgi:DNA-binding PadR family transcriptional regulator